MVTGFSKKTKDSIGYYVYVYSDPKTHIPFYVGKGQGDRVFSHLSEKGNSEKIKKIQEITKRGCEPEIDILVHNIDSETAFKVEAAVIDLIGIENLTNEQRGHESSTYGKISVNDIEKRYNPDIISINDVVEDVIFICVNKSYENTMNDIQLYDTTRCYWNVGKGDNVSKAKYAFSMYFGIVLEVYEISQWLPALSTLSDKSLQSRTKKEINDLQTTRKEFVGNFAPDSIRNKYKGKVINDVFYTQGAARPYRLSNSIK